MEFFLINFSNSKRTKLNQLINPWMSLVLLKKHFFLFTIQLLHSHPKTVALQMNLKKQFPYNGALLKREPKRTRES